MTLQRSLLQAFSLLLFIALSACVDDDDVGSAHHSIIGGEVTTAAEFPTVVSIEYAPGDWTCTGTLIAAQWVLTAAHCFLGEPTELAKVRFDADDITTGEAGRVVEIAEVHVHPQFDDDIWDNDIALLKLTAPQTDRTPTPIHEDSIAPNTTLLQVGYGNSDDAGNGSGVLRMLAGENVDCASLRDDEVLDDILICFDGRIGAAACDGDSGGPVFVETVSGYEVVGINSGATGDGCLDGWDINTLVIAELDFVNEVGPYESDSGAGGCSVGASSRTTVSGALWLLLMLAWLFRFRQTSSAAPKWYSIVR